MHKRFTGAAALVAILALLLVPVVASAQTASSTSSLIVKLVAGLSAEQQAQVIARNGGVETSSVAALRLHVVEVLASELAATLVRYQSDPDVVSVEENKRRQWEMAPSDALYSSQWALPRIAWDLVYDTMTPAGSAIVALLDSGIDAAHPDLGDKVIAGTSILDGSNGLSDPSGHGTALAGIIAAQTGSSEGIAGVAFAGVRVMPVTVLNANGEGWDSDVIAGVVWAADHGADVILMAFSNPGFSQNLQDAIDYAWSRGVVLVAAVGNNGQNAPTFPAGHRGVVGVSATDSADSLAAFSNSGTATFLAAPGVDIQTTWIGDAYTVASGTSTSAAMVAGVAAFMKAVDPSLTNGVIVGRMARMADPAGTQEQTGNGRVNIARALVDTSMEEVQPAGADPVGNGGPFVGPYLAAARNFTVNFAGTGTGRVTISVSAGTLSFNTTGSGACTGTGSGTPSVTITGTCTSLQSSSNSATITFAAAANGASSFAGWSNGSGGLATCSGSPLISPCSVVLAGGSHSMTVTFNAPIPLTPSFSASNKTYDGTTGSSVSFTGFTPSVGGDNVSVTYASAAFADKNVGTGKTVTVSGLALTGADAYKYTLTSTSVTTNANITARPITVTADPKTKVYGDADPPLTYQVTSGSLVGGNSLTGALGRDPGENVGSYAIKQGSLAVSDGNGGNNYALTFAGASLAITPRPLTITAANQTKVLGQVFTFSGTEFAANGLVNGDTVGTVTLTSAGAPASAPVGSYEIAPSAPLVFASGLVSNYSITYNKGILYVIYAPAGTACLGAPGHQILQPINVDGSSVFKQKSTVPAKFRVCDANGVSVGSVGVVKGFYLYKVVTGTVTSEVSEQVESTNTFTDFRWDPTDQQWIFNMSTKNHTAGRTYYYEIELNDGTDIKFEFGLK